MKRTIDSPSDKDKDDKDRNNTWRYLCQIEEITINAEADKKKVVRLTQLESKSETELSDKIDKKKVEREIKLNLAWDDITCKSIVFASGSEYPADERTIPEDYLCNHYGDARYTIRNI